MHVLEQIKEKYVVGLVRDGRGETLAENHVPAGALVFQVWVGVERLMYGGRCLLVQLIQLNFFVSDY